MSISWATPTSLKACESFIRANVFGCLPLALWREDKMVPYCFCATDKSCIINTINNSTTNKWAASRCSAPLPAPPLAWTSSTPMCDRWRKCLLFLPHADKGSGGRCTSYRFLSRRQLWIFTKTLNIDCRVLTQNLNEIKTNINHTLALQQTLLGP